MYKCGLSAIHIFVHYKNIISVLATEHLMVLSQSSQRLKQFALHDLPQKGFLFTAPPLRAPGYELHRGVGYYKIHSGLKTWHEARQICAQEGGHLAITNSEEESKVLQSMFAPVAAKLNVVWAFIGFHDMYNEGQYLTVFGKESLSKDIERTKCILSWRCIYRSQSRDSSVSIATRTVWTA